MTRLGVEQSGIRILAAASDFSVLQIVQTCSGSHTTTHAGILGLFPEVECLGHDAELHLEPKLRKSGDIPLLPLYAFKAWTGTSYFFLFFYLHELSILYTNGYSTLPVGDQWFREWRRFRPRGSERLLIHEVSVYPSLNRRIVDWCVGLVERDLCIPAICGVAWNLCWPTVEVSVNCSWAQCLRSWLLLLTIRCCYRRPIGSRFNAII